MKITLISPYPDITSFGIRTISSYLKQHHFETQLIFLPDPFGDNFVVCEKRYDENTLDEVANICSKSDLIGVTLMTNFFDGAVQITQNLKKHLSTPILWGGIHPTVRPEECLKYADMVCVGDGEIAVLELAQRLAERRDYSDVPNICLKKNGYIIKNSLKPIIQDMDSIPPPDYELTENYVLDNNKLTKMDYESFKRVICNTIISKAVRAGVYMTLTGRGCPHSCSYCCNDSLRKLYHGQRYLRWRSTEHVINELVAIKEKFDYIGYIWLSDDAFFARKAEDIKEFCEAYKKKVNLPFHCLGSPLTVTGEKLEYLVDAGLDSIQMGIEAGSRHIQEVFNRKHMNNERVMNAIQAIMKYKDRISTIGYDFIMDVPYETDADRIETLRFISTIPKPYIIGIFSLVLYPGTSLYDRVKADNPSLDEERDIYRKMYGKVEENYPNLLLMLCKNGKLPHLLLKILISKYVVAVLNHPALRPVYKLIFHHARKALHFIKGKK